MKQSQASSKRGIVDERRPRVGALRDGALFALIACLFAPFLLGHLQPDLWWGTHFPAFLPGPWALALFALAIASPIVFPALATLAGRLAQTRAAWYRRPLVVALAVAGVYAILCHLLTTATDIYGDARRNLEFVERIVARGNPDWARGIFGMNLLFRETGEHFISSIVALIAGGLDIPARSAFDLFNAGLGLCFALAWTLFVLRQLRDGATRALLVLAGLLAGFAPLFTDHTEIYAPAVLCLTLFLITAALALQTRDRRLPLLLVLLFVVAAKSHFANLILALPLLIVSLDVWIRPFISRRRLLLLCALPLVAAFLILYFGVMENHAISRFVDDAGRARTFWLPLVDAETNGAPRYTLLSPSHLFDYLNVVLLWSAPALLLVCFAWIFRRKRLLPATPPLALIELVLLVYAGVFFATNPVLGMPRDWDLFTIPAAALLVYAVLVARRIEEEGRPPLRLIGAGFGLLLFALPVFAVNHSPQLLWPRIESMGVSSYRSYWKGASYLMNVSAKLGDPDEATELGRRVGGYARLRPYALPADGEIADLALRISRLYSGRGDFRRARPYARDALIASLGNTTCIHEMSLVQFGLEDFASAYQGARALCEAEPENPTYLDLAFKSGLRSRDWAGAMAFGERYLRLRPEDSEAARLYREIQVQLEGGRP